MTENTVVKNHTCIQRALAVVGDKWSPLLVRDMTQCPKTFSELEDSLQGISPRTLSQRLDMLQAEGIIQKESYCDKPPRYKYSLTKKGGELKSILLEMSEWGERYA
jgi:DNA-binding HxlR family transcriptional regulator